MRKVAPIATVAAALVVGLASPSAAPPRDHAAVALNVLPPGQTGSLNSTFQQVMSFRSHRPRR